MSGRAAMREPRDETLNDSQVITYEFLPLYFPIPIFEIISYNYSR